MKRQMSDASSENEWQRVAKSGAPSDTKNDNQLQRMTNEWYNEWYNERQRVVIPVKLSFLNERRTYH